MDNIKRNNSDSDLSDDWNVIDPPPIISESESIEVLEYDADHEIHDVEEDNERRRTSKIEELKASDHEKRSAVKTVSTSYDSSLPVLRTDEAQLTKYDNRHMPPYYCVFPEEFHNVFANAHYTNVNTSEVMCSISLIILCAIASSLMVISTDNVMPSFLDVLVWQSLPDHQKDININNPGLISEQLKLYKDRNEFLENKLNHLKLAVKAYEENMVDETALLEFVTDLQRSSSILDEKKTNNIEVKEFLSLFSQTVSQPSSNVQQKLAEDNIGRKNFKSDNFDEVKHSPEEGINSNNKYTDVKNKNFKRYSDNNKERPVSLFVKLLSLFNTNTDIGELLNRVSLLLINSKDRLMLFQKLHPGLDHYNSKDSKFKKLSLRIQNVQNNFDSEISKSFYALSTKFYNNIKKLDQNLNNYICKNIKNHADTVFINWCVEKKYNVEARFNKPDDPTYVKNIKQDLKSDQSRPASDGDDYKYSNLYKTDEDAIGKSKINNLENDRRMYDDKTSNGYAKDHIKSNMKKPSFHGERYHKNKHASFKNENHYKTSGETVKVVNDKQASKDKIEYVDYKDSTKANEKEVVKSSFEDSEKDETNVKKNSDEQKSNSETHYHSKNNNIHNSKNNKKLKPNHDGNKRDARSNPQKTGRNSDKFKGSKIDEKDGKKYIKRKKNEKMNSKPKDKYNKKIPFNDISKFKNYIMNSIHSYIDDLLMDLKTINGNEEYTNDNSTIFTNSKLVPGDWFLTLGQRRSEIRAEKKKSDWLFDRAEGRHHLRDESNPAEGFFQQTMWFFRRAWQRNRYRY